FCVHFTEPAPLQAAHATLVLVSVPVPLHLAQAITRSPWQTLQSLSLLSSFHFAIAFSRVRPLLTFWTSFQTIWVSFPSPSRTTILSASAAASSPICFLPSAVVTITISAAQSFRDAEERRTKASTRLIFFKVIARSSERDGGIIGGGAVRNSAI